MCTVEPWLSIFVRCKVGTRARTPTEQYVVSTTRERVVPPRASPSLVRSTVCSVHLPVKHFYPFRESVFKEFKRFGARLRGYVLLSRWDSIRSPTASDEKTKFVIAKIQTSPTIIESWIFGSKTTMLVNCAINKSLLDFVSLTILLSVKTFAYFSCESYVRWRWIEDILVDSRRYATVLKIIKNFQNSKYIYFAIILIVRKI